MSETYPVRSLTVRLPWPARELIPNRGDRRGGFWARVTATKAARETACILALEAVQSCELEPGAALKLTTNYFAPKRRPDKDALDRAMKPYTDGLFDALNRRGPGIYNDRDITAGEQHIYDDPEGAGFVELTLSEADGWWL